MNLPAKKRRVAWRVLCVLFIILSVITFSPWVIPAHVIGPQLWGIPYTLWVGFIVATIFVLMTYMGSIVFPGSENEDAS